MDEVTNAPSDGVVEATAIATTVPAATEAPAPPSARDALDKAFETVFDEKPATGRDEAGRFAAKTKAEGSADPEGTPELPPGAEPAPKPLMAPQRFSKAAQDAWAQAPEPVRAETERAITELTQGLEKYKGSAEAFEPVRRFDEMAKASGTTLDQALERYVGIEQALRKDFVGGLAAICRNYGLDPRAVAQHLAGAPQQGGQSPEVASLKAEIAELKRNVGGVSQSFAERDALAKIEAFAASAPEFESVSETVAKLLKSGYAADLQGAYDAAIRLNPEVAARIEAAKAAKQSPAAPAAPPTPDQPSAHTRKAGLSISGSPSGSNPGSRKPAGTTREALDRAFSQIGL
ncbi:hypothetical protein [Xanthobacter autotrophicus]|uniref:hypothetical protein n=1 Tax=Xanthobacter autotrophicus TaxID=280 RepID=UPI00372A14BF